MRCLVAGGALNSAKFSAYWATSSPSACRTPNPKPLSLVEAVPHVAEVRVDLSRKEERMGHRECRDRSALSFRDEHAIGRLERNGRLVRNSAESVLLVGAACFAPRESRCQRRRESAKSAVIFISDPFVVRARDRIHPDQIRSAIHREPQIAGEAARREAWKTRFETVAIRLDRA